MTVTGDRVFTEVVKLNEVVRVGPWFYWAGVLARGRDTEGCLLAGSEERPCEAMARSQEEKLSPELHWRHLDYGFLCPEL